MPTRGRTLDQGVRHNCSDPAQSSASYVAYSSRQMATSSARVDTSGACVPLWGPAVSQQGRLTGAFAHSLAHSRQLHQAVCSKVAIVGRQTAVAGGRHITAVLGRQRYSTTSQLAMAGATDWRSAARRIAFKRLKVLRVL